MRVSDPRLTGNRTFTWITPSGRKPSEYELFTVGHTYSPDMLLDVGWPVRFDDGTPPWREDSSAIRLTDWSRYRDPCKLWERPYVSRVNQDGQAFGRVLPVLVQGSGQDMTAQWADEVLAGLYAAWPFVEYGMFMALAYTVREARADTLQFRSVFLAADHIRVLQDIVLHLDYIHDEIPGFSEGDGRRRWLSDPMLQPTRKLVERLASSRDWVEILVVVTLVLEPVLGYFAKAEILAGLAARNGDRATPYALAQCAPDAADASRAGRALVDLLLADALFGDANREIIRGWLADWGSACLDACTALSDLFEGCGASSVECAAALGRVAVRQSQLVTDI
jgi:methane monooxygenase component A beta chain/propane monooxygenase small subunit